MVSLPNQIKLQGCRGLEWQRGQRCWPESTSAYTSDSVLVVYFHIGTQILTLACMWDCLVIAMPVLSRVPFAWS